MEKLKRHSMTRGSPTGVWLGLPRSSPPFTYIWDSNWSLESAGVRLSGRCCTRWFPSDSAVIKDDRVSKFKHHSIFLSKALTQIWHLQNSSLTDLMICPRSHDNLLIIRPLPFYHLISLRWFMYNEKNY